MRTKNVYGCFAVFKMVGKTSSRRRSKSASDMSTIGPALLPAVLFTSVPFTPPPTTKPIPKTSMLMSEMLGTSAVGKLSNTAPPAMDEAFSDPDSSLYDYEHMNDPGYSSVDFGTLERRRQADRRRLSTPPGTPRATNEADGQSQGARYHILEPAEIQQELDHVEDQDVDPHAALYAVPFKINSQKYKEKLNVKFKAGSSGRKSNTQRKNKKAHRHSGLLRAAAAQQVDDEPDESMTMKRYHQEDLATTPQTLRRTVPNTAREVRDAMRAVRDLPAVDSEDNLVKDTLEKNSAELKDSMKKLKEDDISLERQQEVLKRLEVQIADLHRYSEELQVENLALKKAPQPLDGGDVGSPSLKKQFHDLKEDCDVLQNTVHRLNIELSKYQSKYSPVQYGNQAQEIVGLPSKGPIPSWLINTKYLAPLFLAYDDELAKKDKAIYQYEEIMESLRVRTDILVKENEELSSKTSRSGTGGADLSQLEEQARLVLEENQILMEQIDVQQNKFKDLHKAHAQEMAKLSRQIVSLSSEKAESERQINKLRTSVKELKEKYDESLVQSEDKTVHTVTQIKSHTSGRAVIGNATVTVTIVPPNGNYDWRDPYFYPTLEHKIEYFEGRIDLFFSKQDLLNKANAQTMENMEFMFNVTTYDWYLAMQRSGYGSTFCYSSRIIVKWVGDAVRTFKPGSVFTATVALTYADGTPVTDERRGITVIPSISNSGIHGGGRLQPVIKLPINGMATFAFETHHESVKVTLTATYDGAQSTKPIELRAYKYYSPSRSYISVTTSTRSPKVNQYIIFHVKTSIFVPKIYYQIVSQGNILIGDELQMISRQKTFSIALSRDMVPSARILVFYIRQPEEIVVDALNFFVNGTRLNPIHLRFNRGKDFTRHTVEVNAFSDPGSYAAFSAIPYDLYARGLNDGISENLVIDELLTYDSPANGSYLHKWRINENEFRYNFFSSNGYGVDANRTFHHAGLTVMTDADVTKLGINCEERGMLPCFDGTCYANDSRCNNVYDCPNDWADEQGCVFEEVQRNRRHPLDRISHVMRFYDDSTWLWREKFVKPDGRIDFRVDVPRYPLTWVVNGFSLSQEKGFGLMEAPARYDATRLMYIQVESPIYVVRGEQIGFRVTVFNYWFADDYLEIMVKLHGSPNYLFVHVQDFGIVDSYNPQVSSGDHETIVFLEPGESKDIYVPVLPIRWEDGKVDVTISATSYLSSDVVTRSLHVQYDGVPNYYHTPYLVDLITKGSVIVNDLKVNVPQSFILPEQREHVYVFGSAKALVTVFGDVVTPGFFEEYLTAENILRRPYGSAEQNMFNYAYNLLTLRFKKDSKQLSDAVLRRTLSYLNVAFQRQLSYMTPEGGVKMFQDDVEPRVWLTAFVAKTLDESRFGEWEQTLFIPGSLINSMVLWLCHVQNESGAFNETMGAPVYDRKLTKTDVQTSYMYNDPIPLTAYVLIALHKITGASDDAQSCIETARQKAAAYLTSQVNNIDPVTDVFHLAITAYALSLTKEKSRSAYNILYKQRRNDTEELYWADKPVPENPSSTQNGLRYHMPRVELDNDAYAVQTTAYALLAHISHNGLKYERDSIMRWLNFKRNYNGGFVSTQDTLAAMEALVGFTKVDPNRNVFDMAVALESTATPNWKAFNILTRNNYTNLQVSSLPDVWGFVKVQVQGAGRSVLQLAVSVNVEYPWLQKPPANGLRAFDITMERLWGGRNFSQVEITACARWLLQQKSVRSGLAVMELDLPTGFVVMNDTLRAYVQSQFVPTLKRAEFYYRKVVFYFDYLDQSKTCVRFQANRWWPVANTTKQNQMRVYDYYEPGLHNTTIYWTQELFNQNLCWVCGSFQCPYCPTFNVGTVIKSSFTILSIVIVFFTHRYLIRT